MNLFALPPLPLSEELVSVLEHNKTLRVERIVSTGQTSGWYDQEENEFVVLLQGSAAIAFEDGRLAEMAGGDTLLLPARCRHRVARTSAQPPCIWLCIFWR